jgi:DNA (cytosine-5)-methyltransferase 1
MLQIAYKFEDPFLVKEININNQIIQSKIIPYDDLDDDLAKLWKLNFLLGKKVKYQQKKEINIVDICSSVGGLTLGVSEAAKTLGMHPRSLYAADIDKKAIEVYKANFSPMHAKNISISELVDFGLSNLSDEKIFSFEPEILDEDLKKNTGNVDVFVAGPPCQGHSNLNNSSRRDDPRNNLYIDALVIAVLLKSKNIILENVRTIQKDHKNVIEYAKKILNAYGYKYEEAIINANDIGGGQTRIRHFLIASHKNFIITKDILKSNNWPKITLKDLIKIKPILELDNCLMREAVLSNENKDRIDYLFDHNLHDLPDHVRPDCHKNGNHGYDAVYGRLKWDLPSPTITTGFLSPGRGRYIHPDQKRTLIAHEAARIQGFPDSFQFLNPAPTALAKWIGDAVPSSLSYITGLSVLSSFFY